MSQGQTADDSASITGNRAVEEIIQQQQYKEIFFKPPDKNVQIGAKISNMIESTNSFL